MKWRAKCRLFWTRMSLRIGKKILERKTMHFNDVIPKHQLILFQRSKFMYGIYLWGCNILYNSRNKNMCIYYISLEIEDDSWNINHDKCCSYSVQCCFYVYHRNYDLNLLFHRNSKCLFIAVHIYHNDVYVFRSMIICWAMYICYR